MPPQTGVNHLRTATSASGVLHIGVYLPRDVRTVLDRAAAHGDEHVLKFTDTAVEAYQRRPDPDLLRAAQFARTLIGRPE